MATKLYLGRSSFTAIDPGTLGTWGFNYRQRYKMGTTKLNTSFATSTITGMSTSASTLMRQFISQPLVAGTTLTSADTWTVNYQLSESSTSLNIFPKIYCSIVSAFGIPRGYAFTMLGGAEASTSLSSREMSATGLVGSYVIQTGDRIVLEVGWDKQASNTGSGSIRFGDNGASDLSGSSDTGSGDNPWFQYSGSLSFSAEGAGATAGDNYELTTYISAVLDEYV